MIRKVVDWSWENVDSQNSFIDWIGFSDIEYAKEQVVIMQKLAGISPCKCMDVGCGNGRHSLALSMLGYDVKGIDIADTYLSQAIANAEKYELEIEFVKQRGSDISAVDEYDFILMYNHTLGFMNDDEIAKQFGCIYKALKVGGKLIFVSAGPKIVPNMSDNVIRTWEEKGDKFILVDKQIVDGYRLENCITIDTVTNEIIEFREMQKAYSLADQIEILQKANFNNIKAYKDIGGVVATVEEFGTYVCVK